MKRLARTEVFSMDQLLFSYFFLALEILIIHSIPNVKIKRKYYFFFFFIQFAFLSGFRGLDIHNDTLSYASHFDNVSSKGHFWEIEKELFNPGYLVIEKFIHNNITNTVLGFNIITSTVICLCTFFLFYKKSRHIGFAIFLYYISGEFFGQIAVLRESFAVLVGYCCILLISKKEYLKSIPLILVAISFHNSSFILFLLLLLVWTSPSTKTKVIIFFSVVFVTYAIAPVMELVLNLLAFETKYFTEGVDRGFASANGFFNGTIGLLTALFVYMMIKNNKGNCVHPVWYDIIYVYTIISVLSLRLPILSRYLMFFSPFLFIIVSNLIFASKKNVRYGILVSCVLASNIIVKQQIRPEWISIFPYHFYDDSQLGLLLDTYIKL